MESLRPNGTYLTSNLWVIDRAKGDRLRVTAGGTTKDGKHRLSNGSLYTVEGFTPQGDLIVNRDWVIAKNFGHVAHGYTVTSHASQGKTVDQVFIGQSSLSFPASSRRQFYVSVSRGRQQAMIFTDDKQELRKAIARADEPPSAIDLADSRSKGLALCVRLKKHLARMRRIASLAWTQEANRPEAERTPEELAHAR